MTKQKITLNLCVLIALFSVTLNCTSNNSDEGLDLTMVNSVTVDEYEISLFSDHTIETGSNELFWKVEQDGNSVPIQSFTIKPMMDMHTMQHSTHYTNPTTSEVDKNYQQSDITFIMASGEMGTWAINFEVETKTGTIISGSIPVDVGSSWRLNNVRSSENEMYFISWVTPYTPKNGNNEIMFKVFKRETMMSFPALADAELIIYPYMDMGSGQGHSTSFEQPEAMGEGFYNAEINYSMSGTWTTTAQIVTANNDTLPEVTFEYNVKAQ